MRFIRVHALPLALTAALCLAQLVYWLPAVTIIGEPGGPDLTLRRSIFYWILAPISNTLDFLTFLTVGRAAALLIGAGLIVAAWRYLRGRKRPRHVGEEVRVALRLLGVFLLLGVVAALVPRPAPRLAVPEQSLVVDYHTHTNASHDGRWLVDNPDAWHRRQGFDAWFVTDHNRVGPADRRTGGPLPGIEISAYRLHVVGLGPGDTITRTPFVRDKRGAMGVFAALHAQNRVAILSLPEYWRSYWDELDDVITAGADGFEIVSCAPKGLAFGAFYRESAIETARWHRSLIVGASDQHGWGKVTCVWNVIEASRDSLLPVLRERANGVGTNRVVARTLAVAEYPTWLTVIAGPWTIFRTIGPEEALVWLLWIWYLAKPWRPLPAAKPKPQGPRTIRPGQQGPASPTKPQVVMPGR